MKNCITCKELKDTTHFRKHRRDCKICEKRKFRLFRLTKKGLIKTIYDNQKIHSKRRRHPLPTYSREDLQEWLYSQSLFHVLYDEWKNKKYITPLVPSVDRIANNIPYTLSNIQLTTWEDNNNRAKKEKQNGTLDTAGYKCPR